MVRCPISRVADLGPIERDLLRSGFFRHNGDDTRHVLLVRLADQDLHKAAMDPTNWLYTTGDGEASFSVRWIQSEVPRSISVSTENVATEIQGWLRDNVTGDRENCLSDKPLIENVVLTSLQTVDLVTFLEERFGLIVEDEEFDEENFGSVETIAGLVASQKTAAETANSGCVHDLPVRNAVVRQGVRSASASSMVVWMDRSYT